MTDPIVQAAADVIAKMTHKGFILPDSIARAVVAAVTPLIRAQIADEIEECIDWSPGRYTYGDNDGYQHSARIARGSQQ